MKLASPITLANHRYKGGGKGRAIKLRLCRSCGDEFPASHFRNGSLDCSFCRAKLKSNKPEYVHPAVIEFLYRRPAA